MMGPLGGGRREKNKTINNNRMKRLKGGCGGCALTPANFNGLDTSAMDVDVNFAKNSNMFSSNQVGGGMSYGFGGNANQSDINAFGGSYAPMSNNSCTGANLNNNRGGNNFMAGGGRRKRRTNKKINRSIRKYKGDTGKYKWRSSSNRSKRSKRSSSTKKNSMGGKKYSQKGCSNKY